MIYSELKSAIADFLNRQDLTSVIPTFIKFTEADINRKLRHRRMVEIEETDIVFLMTVLAMRFTHKA